MHQLAVHAVFLGGGAGHHIGLVLGCREAGAAALGIDGGTDVRFRLVGKAAQCLECVVDYLTGAGGAVLDGAGEEHVTQRDAVIVDIEAGDVLGDLVDDAVVIFGIDIVALAGQKTIIVFLGQLFPGSIEVVAVAGAAVIIGGLQRLADLAVVFVFRLLAPLCKGQRAAGGAGKLVGAVGLAADIAGIIDDGAGVAALIAGGKLAQQLKFLVIGGGGAGPEQEQRQHQCGAQEKAQGAAAASAKCVHEITLSES